MRLDRSALRLARPSALIALLGLLGLLGCGLNNDPPEGGMPTDPGGGMGGSLAGAWTLDVPGSALITAVPVTMSEAYGDPSQTDLTANAICIDRGSSRLTASWAVQLLAPDYDQLDSAGYPMGAGFLGVNEFDPSDTSCSGLPVSSFFVEITTYSINAESTLIQGAWEDVFSTGSGTWSLSR